jgi:flagellar basal body-associated protein FliL
MKIIFTVVSLILVILFPTLHIICNHNLPQKKQAVFLDLYELDLDSLRHVNKEIFSVLRINLELENEKDKKEIIKLMPRVKQVLILCILDLKNKDLIGSSDLYRIRKEALIKINKIAYPVLVQNILFNKLLRS